MNWKNISKFIIPAVLLCSIFCICTKVSAQYERNFEFIPDDFKCPIAGIKESITRADEYLSETEPQPKEIRHSWLDTCFYNRDGYSISFVDYDNGADEDKETIEYVRNNKNIIEIKTKGMNSWETTTLKYFYDKNDNLTRIVSFDSLGKFTNIDSLKYNDKNRIIAHNGYDTTGTIIFKTTYSYDVKGYKFERYYDGLSNGAEVDSLVNYKIFCTYDSSGNMTEENLEGGDVSFSGVTKYKYDNKGNAIESRYFGCCGDTNSLTEKYTYEYDQHHNKVKETEVDINNTGNDRITTWTYDYDDRGNWTKITNIVAGFLSRITYRKLIYF